jgi:hypothetical protein
MYGIATTGNSSISGYNNRMVLLEVTGVLNAKDRNTHYTMKVPYARLSQTVQRICRAGGKIANVSMALFDPSEVAEAVSIESVEQTPEVEAVNIETVEPTPEVETVATETIVVEITPQPTPATSKETTAKAKGMGEKQTKNTKRDRKPKSRQ